MTRSLPSQALIHDSPSTSPHCPQKKKLRISWSSLTLATPYPTQSLNLLVHLLHLWMLFYQLGSLMLYTFKVRHIILWPFWTYILIHGVLLKDPLWVGTENFGSGWSSMRPSPIFLLLSLVNLEWCLFLLIFSNDLFIGSWMTVLRNQESEQADSIQKEMAQRNPVLRPTSLHVRILPSPLPSLPSPRDWHIGSNCLLTSPSDCPDFLFAPRKSGYMKIRFTFPKRQVIKWWTLSFGAFV